MTPQSSVNPIAEREPGFAARIPRLALSALRSFGLSPASRVSLGLTSLMVAIVLALDLVFGILPDQTLHIRQARERICENLAAKVVVSLGSSDMRLLQAALREAMLRDEKILSTAIRREDGAIVAQVGDHALHWRARANQRSTLENVRVPLQMGNQPWGGVEVAFTSAAPQSLSEWIRQPIVLLILTLSLCGFVVFSIYLRRVLQYLDPSKVIPDRVRQAFDGFSEGVMVVDPVGRIMLANSTFRSWIQDDGGNLHGRRVQEVPRIKAALPGDPKNHPWTLAMAYGRSQTGDYLEFTKDGGDSIKAVINCSPILDAQARVRGCIVTFDNVTELEKINWQLTTAMRELEESRAQIEKQNEELHKLATRDPLTGCLNRRAFYSELEELFLEARNSGKNLSCIMTDVDYFKSFNDRFGHAAGDAILQTVVRFLYGGLREADLLCRYGGEEFCIILPGVTLEVAQAVAERLRGEVEARTANGLRSVEATNVTASFGVATLMPDVKSPVELIDRADKALYAAKNDGRNCVRQWRPELEVASV
jgi:diguanylate cyclase (GGDEF)-like protein